MNLKLIPIFLVLVTFALPVGAEPAAPGPASAVPGGIYLWSVPAGADNIRFDDRPVLVVAGHAFVGVPIKHSAGVAYLTYEIEGSEHRHEFAVQSKTYTEQRLTIKNQNMVTPPEETLTRIRSEGARQRKLYRRYEPEHQVDEGFVMPLEGIVTSLFGHRRILNGQPRNPHSGLDIAAKTGTPIVSAGAGTVTLADDLYFNGNTVFVDHGQGLVTMYCHMSEIDVVEGQAVAQGEPIGKVGATGRVTGPHLHWSVSLNGNRVDPQTFIALLNEITSSDDASGAPSAS